jgi:AcrR family transcriptional regulator
MGEVFSAKKRQGTENRPLPKGELSRAAILLASAKLATTKGLIGLSLGDLAAEVGMSKSGLYAHFKSKEELELATIDTASVIFEREVLQGPMGVPAGKQRLLALADAFLGHLDRRVFPGGCFFAAVAMELDTRPGPARDRVSEMLKGWLGLLTQCLSDAQSNGEVDAATDVEQAVFETESFLLAANFLFVMTGQQKPLEQARKGLNQLLHRLSPKPKPRKKPSAKRRS